ncbi:unnamed protein product [Symbiodinium natans]|uniref:Uncharacterized protein n=1 Tax=Symbiodinium natans TaxID=878477 RepID=A0A812HYJ1_9DINO|nr:unnamed protein product [Symbiodinium natans]
MSMPFASFCAIESNEGPFQAWNFQLREEAGRPFPAQPSLVRLLGKMGCWDMLGLQHAAMRSVASAGRSTESSRENTPNCPTWAIVDSDAAQAAPPRWECACVVDLRLNLPCVVSRPCERSHAALPA